MGRYLEMVRLKLTQGARENPRVWPRMDHSLLPQAALVRDCAALLFLFPLSVSAFHFPP